MNLNIIDTSYKPQIIKVEIKYSIVFECALGLAMYTYPEVHSKLSQPKSHLDSLHNTLSKQLKNESMFCQQHNTWKILLQLLHEQDFVNVEEFLCFIEQLDTQSLTYLSLPYLDDIQQHNRSLASHGDEKAIECMIEASKEHLFFPQLIQFVSQIDPLELKRHLVTVMRLWYNEVMLKNEPQITAFLRRDYEEKMKMIRKCKPEEVVQWATGIEYKPERNITKVLLLPHYIYRPWTIQANMEGTKIFYYPVSEESLLEEHDSNQPPPLLVQHYKALADENRLKIVKLLFKKERSLKELTEILKIGKTTIHHHLAVLRSAHIVHMRDSLYSINHPSLKITDNKLLQYLESGE